MRTKSGKICTMLMAATILSACKKDSDETNTVPYHSEGVYVVNEGSFGNGDASLSYYSFSDHQIRNNWFMNVNNYPLGDVAQSMLIHDNKGYIVVNNSQKVEVISKMNCNSITSITGFNSPRHMAAYENKGYVSDWFDDNVKIINLNSNMITGSVPTGTGPEQMIISDGKLFVCNIGGWGSDSTVTVIDVSADTVITTLQVGINPNSITKDGYGNLWVLCGGSVGPDYTGGTADDIPGSIWKIDPVQVTILQSIIYQPSDHPLKITYDSFNERIYFLMGTDGYNGSVRYFEMSGSAVNLTQISQEAFYGLATDPVNGTVYAGLAPGFSQNGYVFRYSSNGTLKDSMEAGIAPTDFAFLRKD